MSETLVHVIRHAEAGDRRKWKGPDTERPLTKVGTRQAARLVELFAEEPFTRLVSSPFVRCVQTLEPLAEARGLPIELCDELAEGQPWNFLEKVVLEAEETGSMAVCVHGDAIRDLIGDLIDRGVAHRGKGDFRKGSTWVLGMIDGAIVSARHVPAPPAE